MEGKLQKRKLSNVCTRTSLNLLLFFSTIHLFESMSAFVSMRLEYPSIPDQTVSKSNQLDSEMLNLVSECAQYGQKASIHELFLSRVRG